jgi:hypothetical protein
VFIPVRLPQNAFDLTRSTREMTPAFGKTTPTRDVQAGSTSTPFFPPSLRDIGGDLDRMLAGLAHSSQSQSQVPLGLDRSGGARASVLSSTAPLNAAVSSYQKVQLSFGSSTAVAQVSGTYKGTGAAARATALTVTLDSGGIMGSTGTGLAFHVADQTGATVFSYAGTAKAGQAISLGDDIGLALTFSQGSLVAGEAGRTGVSRTIATTVDANARFNDVDANARPRFEAGATVGAGSFSINGQTIAVNADDSVASVLQRINEQAPEIIASYEDETITLTTRDATRQAIVLGDDTSGFLAATKLQSAGTKVGFVADDQERLADLARFSAVKAGSFRLGDATITVDPASDTLASVLARMSSASGDGGVTAYYDDARDAVIVRGGEGETSLGDDSSGLLAALGLEPGRRVGLAPRETMSLPPGTAARLRLSAAGREATLVEQTLAGPAFAAVAPVEDDQASASGPGALGSARKAKAAYGREVDDAGDGKRNGALVAPRAGVWGKPWSTAPATAAAAYAASPADENDTIRLAG